MLVSGGGGGGALGYWCCTHAWSEVFKTYPNRDLPFFEEKHPKQEFCIILQIILTRFYGGTFCEIEEFENWHHVKEFNFLENRHVLTPNCDSRESV